jgi:hypothetical protein
MRGLNLAAAAGWPGVPAGRNPLDWSGRSERIAGKQGEKSGLNNVFRISDAGAGVYRA